MSRHPNSDEQCPSEDKLSTDCLSLLSRDCASGNDAVQQEQLDRLVRTIILNLDEIGSFVSTLAAFFKNLGPQHAICWELPCCRHLQQAAKHRSGMQPLKSCCSVSSSVRGVLTWQRSVRTRQSQHFSAVVITVPCRPACGCWPGPRRTATCHRQVCNTDVLEGPDVHSVRSMAGYVMHVDCGHNGPLDEACVVSRMHSSFVKSVVRAFTAVIS